MPLRFHPDRGFYEVALPDHIQDWQEDEASEEFLKRIGFGWGPFVEFGCVDDEFCIAAFRSHCTEPPVAEYFVEVTFGSGIDHVFCDGLDEFVRVMRYLEPVTRLCLELKRKDEKE